MIYRLTRGLTIHDPITCFRSIRGEDKLFFHYGDIGEQILAATYDGVDTNLISLSKRDFDMNIHFEILVPIQYDKNSDLIAKSLLCDDYYVIDETMKHIYHHGQEVQQLQQL